jgi:hypothetical protein
MSRSFHKRCRNHGNAVNSIAAALRERRRGPISGKGGFETRPYICCSDTSTPTINAPPHIRSRFLTCRPLKQALNQPFPEQSRNNYATALRKTCDQNLIPG